MRCFLSLEMVQFNEKNNFYFPIVILRQALRKKLYIFILNKYSKNIFANWCDTFVTLYKKRLSSDQGCNVAHIRMPCKCWLTIVIYPYYLEKQNGILQSALFAPLEELHIKETKTCKLIAAAIESENSNFISIFLLKDFFLLSFTDGNLVKCSLRTSSIFLTDNSLFAIN